MTLNRREFTQLVAASPLALSAAKRRPNFVVVMADDMGFSDIGCYGGEIATPNLDRMAREGVRHTQFYNCARCCPTRASLLTGLDPHQAGVGHMIDNLGYPGYVGYLNNRCVTFAESLGLAGYQTYLSGKWHVGEERPHWPLDRGFQRYFGLISGACNYFRRDPGRMMAVDNDPYVPPAQGFYMTDAITDHAISMIGKSLRQSSPFCLYVAYTAPHWPLQALPEDIEKYRDTYRKGWDVIRQERYERQVSLGIVDRRWPLSPRYEKVPAWDSLSAAEQEDWARRMAVYAAQIDRMDQGIGRLLASLKKTGQLNDTVVFFLSDNGGCAEERIGKGPAERAPKDPVPGGPDSFASYRPPWANVSDAPFRLFKHYVHEGGIAAPFIAWSPDLIPRRNALEHTPAHVADLHPTLLRLAGARYPTHYKGSARLPLAGQDIWPVIQGHSQASERRFAWEHTGGRALREGDWKLVAEFNQPWSLYNLAEDRTELRDRSAEEPERVQRMTASWQQWADKVGVVPWEIVKKNKKDNGGSDD